MGCANEKKNSYFCHIYDTDDDGSKCQFEKLQCPIKYEKQYKNIEVDEKKWTDICFLSVNQSETSLWFNERHTRITCSTKAHRIKTRQTNFENLAKQFFNEKYKSTLTPAMSYGIDKESEARTLFQEQSKLKVHQVGLIVCKDQPFLACSPDGIIFNDEFIELLEIKCPFTCQNTVIVDKDNRVSLVPYLLIDECGNIRLKNNDKYFTQIQVSMYVIGATKCHFYVYSQCDQVHLKINRDEEFLGALIAKIELFFFQYFIGHF